MTKMTRRQLYDLIWSKPMRDAAREVGLSSVGLKKVCLRHKVPVPPQGYWNKIQAGHRPTKLPFFDVDDLTLTQAVFASSYDDLPAAVRKVAQRATEARKVSANHVAVDLGRPPQAPAAVALAAALKKASPDEQGLLKCSGPDLPHVRVAPESVNRAVAIVDALLRAADDRGFVAQPGDKHLGLSVDGEIAELTLTEEMRWVEQPPTAEEIAEERRREQAARAEYGNLFPLIYRPTPRPGTYQPHGRLTFELTKKEHGVHGRWRDTRTRKLEKLLSRLLADLVIYAAAAKARRKERERREREWRREQESEAREQAREELLGEQLEAFDELDRLDRYIKAIRRSARRTGLPPPVRTFLSWCLDRSREQRAYCSTTGLARALKRLADERWD
jgi:hypothetical protein